MVRPLMYTCMYNDYHEVIQLLLVKTLINFSILLRPANCECQGKKQVIRIMQVHCKTLFNKKRDNGSDNAEEKPKEMHHEPHTCAFEYD